MAETITYPLYEYPYKYSPISLDLKEHFNNFTENVSVDPQNWNVSGDGVFDDFMETTSKHLKAQFESQRLRGEDYGTAYVQIYIATLQALMQQWNTLAIESKRLEVQLAIAREAKESQERVEERKLEMQWRIALLNAELEEKKIAMQEKIAEMQLELLSQQAAAEDAKKELYRRQIKGFDQDYKQKILKICMDAWAVGFSVARDSFSGEDGIPGPMQKGTIDALFNDFVYTEMDSFEWKPGKHPDAENQTKLTWDKVKKQDSEFQAYVASAQRRPNV
jgi:hypothetical protein